MFRGASVMLPEPLVVIVNGSIGPVAEELHENAVPGMLPEGTNASDSPLQICCDSETGLLFTTGTGLTVA